MLKLLKRFAGQVEHVLREASTKLIPNLELVRKGLHGTLKMSKHWICRRKVILPNRCRWECWWCEMLLRVSLGLSLDLTRAALLHLLLESLLLL